MEYQYLFEGLTHQFVNLNVANICFYVNSPIDISILFKYNTVTSWREVNVKSIYMSLAIYVYHINNIRCGVVIFIETDTRERMWPYNPPVIMQYDQLL